MKIARIMVDATGGRVFDYKIPAGLEDEVTLGCRVSVPFGKIVKSGYVTEILDHSQVKNLKELLRLEKGGAFIKDKVMDLSDWIADYYCSTQGQAIKTVLPRAIRKKGAAFKKQIHVRLLNPESGSEGLTGKQKKIIEILKRDGEMTLVALQTVAECTASPLHTLKKKGLVEFLDASVRRDPILNRKILPTSPLPLQAEQETALLHIKKNIDEKPASGRTVLLYGVTGSGKTEVYLQAIQHALDRGEGAITLVPEISLTPQTMERYVGRFGDRVALLHSALSDGERHDEWHRILAGEADVVIGARSAVFAPVKKLGVIVVDEEHEPSYKQEDAPRYNARDVAVVRGHLEGCVVLLGSATPCLESWRNTKIGKYDLCVLSHRVDRKQMPVMHIVDMRLQSGKDQKRTVFSRPLLDAMQSRLDKKEQTILFLNRRGYSTSLICPSCGFVAKCDHCSVSMTYHSAGDMLLCHLCGSTRKVLDKCPACSDPAFRYSGIGTQRIETVVKKIFPKAVVERMDADATSRKGSHHRILDMFRSGKIDILIGTQMIAKGLHFPNVTLVGVINADLGLHIPDFRAGERTYQLLAQVAGRAGRGDAAGEVIVQTFTPFHPAVQAARRLDFEGFCDQELEFRKELQYPPFSHLACITFRSHSEAKLTFHASAFTGRLREALDKDVFLSELVPAPIARIRGEYRYQLMMKSVSVKKMTQPLMKLLKATVFPEDVKYSVDIDALSLL